MSMNNSRLFPSLLAWLRCFEAVARRGSFTRAAEELHLTQSAISQQVKQLETRLQVSLLRRSQRGVTLTTEGERLYLAVHSGFQAIEVAIGQLRRQLDDAPLNITSAPSFAIRWLMPRLGNFFFEQPKIGLRMHAGFPGLSREILEKQEVDAAIYYEPEPASAGQGEPFLDEWLFPVASPSFLAAHPELLRLENLLPAWCLHDDVPWSSATPYAEWQCWMHGVGEDGFDFQSGQRFNLSQLAVEGAVNGQGIAMGRAAIVLDDLLARRLVNVFGVCVKGNASYYFSASPNSPGKVVAVIDWLRKEAGEFRRLRAKHLSAPLADS